MISIPIWNFCYWIHFCLLSEKWTGQECVYLNLELASSPSKISTHDTMPCGTELCVEMLLYIGCYIFFNIEFLQRLNTTLDHFFLHFVRHVSIFDYCFVLIHILFRVLWFIGPDNPLVSDSGTRATCICCLRPVWSEHCQSILFIHDSI